METLIGLIILGVIWVVSKANLKHKVDNYDMSKVSIGKMSMDVGKIPTEMQRNMVVGKYDKDDEWKI